MSISVALGAGETSRSAVLSTLRSLLRIIDKRVRFTPRGVSSLTPHPLQYTARNGNPEWRQALIAQYRTNLHATGELRARMQLDALDTLTFFSASAEHERLVEEYWPATSLAPDEKLKRTANLVGLAMPRELRDSETRQGGGKTLAEIIQEEKGQPQ
ncbi:hypothetical protein HDU83_007464 [Entophlyctis luteolus]|nr:hypothetical protein HDU83_007464 [Entophlyctis luteolus]KAJ3388714.1 hypothetical protein HDU84_009559 [Entophlyctis sp. JEL0112]